MKKRQEVYDLYWYFAFERQNIFWKKLKGEDAPWTDDVILQTYKFCNSYRVNDRVSQYLLKNVIYNGKKYTPEDIVFRILVLYPPHKPILEDTIRYILASVVTFTSSSSSTPASAFEIQYLNVSLYSLLASNLLFVFCSLETAVNSIALVIFIVEETDFILLLVDCIEEAAIFTYSFLKIYQ